MRKQTTKPKCRNKAGWQDANSRVSESCSVFFSELVFGKDKNNFATTYLNEEFKSKYCAPDASSANLRRVAAVEKWLSTEAKNVQSNAHLRGLDRGFNLLPRVSFYAFLRYAQHLIQNILGPLNDEVVLGSFSGGASTSRARTSSHPAMKFSGQADVTMEATPYVDLIHRQSELFRQYGILYNLKEVQGAKLFTVPKKTEIDRCACKEPDVNMFLQKGVGRHIRHQLRRFGINLNDQSVNRRLALIGSLDGSLATLDLSSASDTVTISCVEALLPRDWFLYLNDIRSQVVEVDGNLIRTEMFSSMGNGFTFELESLLFFALMKTTQHFENVPGVISVYGDDLIIPSGMYESACWILSEFGFSVNESKSFSTGPFRESCGGHYFNGEDVTPFYLKRPVTHLTDVIRVANQFRRWAMADSGRRYADSSLYPLWVEMASYVPRCFWGGRDYSLDTQLVAPCPPDRILVRSVVGRPLPELGRYAFWHNANWNRSSEPDNYQGGAGDTSSKCRSRRAKPGAPYIDHYFFEEVVI